MLASLLIQQPDREHEPQIKAIRGAGSLRGIDLDQGRVGLGVEGKPGFRPLFIAF